MPKTTKKRPTSRGKARDPVAAAEDSARFSVEEIKREAENRVRRRTTARTADRKPMVKVDVPTKIGGVCSEESGRYVMTDVAVLDVDAERSILAATNGRMLALVETDVERVNDPGEAGIVPTWLPRAFGQPLKKGPRTLRLVRGDRTNLFGAGITWVDDDSKSFAEQIEAGVFPPLDNLVPSLLEGPTVCVTLNAENLAKLAKALSAGADGAGITLFVPVTKDKACDRPVPCLGTHGIGVIMPGTPPFGYHQARDAYTAMRGRAMRVCNARPKHMGDVTADDSGSVFDQHAADPAPLAEPEAPNDDGSDPRPLDD